MRTGAEVGPTTGVDDVPPRRASARVAAQLEVGLGRVPNAGVAKDGARKVVPGLVQAAEAALDPLQLPLGARASVPEAGARARPGPPAAQDAGLLEAGPGAAVAGMHRLQVARRSEVGRPREARPHVP